MATTTDVYKGGFGGGTGLFPCPIQCHQKILDLSVEECTTPAANDVYNVFAVPAGTFVFGVFGYVLTADPGDGTLTFDIGDAAAATDVAVTIDGWVDGADAETASAYTALDSANYAASGGKFYATDSVITVKMLGAATTGLFKIDLRMLCVPVFP